MIQTLDKKKVLSLGANYFDLNVIRGVSKEATVQT